MNAQQMKGFCYEQRSGTLWVINWDHDCPIATGYAGAAGHVNNPESENLPQKGPLPQGYYRMRLVDHNRFAAPAIRLDPEPETEMHGRAGMYIHGDNARGDGSASTGCIVLDYRERSAIAALMDLGFDRLKVVP